MAGLDQKTLDGASWLLGSQHALNILVKMTPSESTLYADLVLSVSKEYYDKNKDLF